MVKQVVGACSVVLALTVAASAQTCAGGEFRINTYTTGYQGFARAAMEPDGDFVVVWTSFAQDGSDYGAFGQRFEASGAPRGSEFRINSYTTGFQGLPHAAVGSRPNELKTVTWAAPVNSWRRDNVGGMRCSFSRPACG